MGQMLLDVWYFFKRVTEEIARARGGRTRFSIAAWLGGVLGDAEHSSL